MIYNLPFPFKVEDEAIVQGKNSHKMLPYLINGAKVLEKSGASFGILPCNTLHKYIKEIRNSVDIPFLSILDETAKELKKQKIKTVGILATATTAKERIYDSALKQQNIEVLYPTKTEQNQINKIIIELLNNVKSKKHSVALNKICNSLHKKGAESVLLACTDLQNIEYGSLIPTIDTTEILIKASLREMNK